METSTLHAKCLYRKVIIDWKRRRMFIIVVLTRGWRQWQAFRQRREAALGAFLKSISPTTILVPCRPQYLGYRENRRCLEEEWVHWFNSFRLSSHLVSSNDEFRGLCKCSVMTHDCTQAWVYWNCQELNEIRGKGLVRQRLVWLSNSLRIWWKLMYWLLNA